MDLSDEDANLLLDDSPNGVNEGNATASTSSATPVSTRKLKRQRFSRKNKVVKKSKKSMPQKPILAVPKLLEKSSISEVCQINEVSLKLVKETMKPLYDVDLELEKLQPYPFFRAVDENWVARFTELLDNGEFNYRQSMFTVCKLDEHGRQYLVLDGNHRLNALIQKYGEKCSSCKVYCRVYGVLSKDDIFSLCLDLTKPSLSLELRFLDQIEIVRKFMDEKKIVKTSKVYESHIKLHSLLMENPNECAIEIAQWPDEDYKIIKIFLLAFQDNKIKEHPTARALHYINVTSNGKLPDLKAKNFWNCVIKAVKKIRNQPQFLERLKSIGILYASLEEASTDLVGEQRTDKQLFDALTSRTYMAHVGRVKQICTLKSVKQKLQHLLKPVCENSCKLSVLDLTLPIFDSLFSTASCIESNEQNFNSSFVADSQPEDEIRKWDFII
uniref:ParB/Sulfiredoxin domain-containing protein n=1 Tax=Panagrolaimus davidi TaxID=227884 RepID=A0A914PH49_9BILA